MRFPRIYHPRPMRCSQCLLLDTAASRHILRVLRLQPGDRLALFDGEGNTFQATLTAQEGDSAQVCIDAVLSQDTESPLPVTLIQGISRGERMDYTLQKSVELGVTRVVPLITRRCGVKLSGQRLEKRLHHWRAVVTHACEQCGRSRLPAVTAPVTLQAICDDPATHDPLPASEPQHLTSRIVLDPNSRQGLASLSPAPTRVVLLIGPEGGLDTSEISLLTHRAAFQRIRLGPRTLRTETAGVAALAALQALWGDF